MAPTDRSRGPVRPAACSCPFERSPGRATVRARPSSSPKSRSPPPMSSAEENCETSGALDLTRTTDRTRACQARNLSTGSRSRSCEGAHLVALARMDGAAPLSRRSRRQSGRSRELPATALRRRPPKCPGCLRQVADPRRCRIVRLGSMRSSATAGAGRRGVSVDTERTSECAEAGISQPDVAHRLGITAPARPRAAAERTSSWASRAARRGG